MKFHRSITLALAAVLAAGLPGGCVAPGSKEAQVATWQRQVEHNPDARVKREHHGSRNWHMTDAQEGWLGLAAIAGTAVMVAGHSANMGRFEVKR